MMSRLAQAIVSKLSSVEASAGWKSMDSDTQHFDMSTLISPLRYVIEFYRHKKLVWYV